MSEVKMSGPGVDAMQQWSKDAEDGAALRRLRDLAPVTAGIVIGWTHGRVHIRVTSFDATTLGDGIAATIASAADKCREAMG